MSVSRVAVPTRVPFLAFVATVVVALVAMLGVLPLAQSAVLGVIGGTGNPTGQQPDVAQTVGGSLTAGRDVQYIWTPQELWPATGTMTLDQSVAEGTALVIVAIQNQPDPDATYVGVSQGAVVLGGAINYFAEHPESGPPVATTKFVLLANPIRPNGGFLVRISGITIPILGVSGQDPSLPTQYQTVDSAWAYDLWATAPLYANNPLSWANAFMGVFNPLGPSLHETDPDYTNPDNDVRTVVVGNTTYHTLIPKHLPMYQPLVDLGLERLVNVIEPLTKVWVDAGYYQNDPAADPGTYRPLQLAMPVENIVRALKQTPSAIAEGLGTIGHDTAPITVPEVVGHEEQRSGSSDKAEQGVFQPDNLHETAIFAPEQPNVTPLNDKEPVSTETSAAGDDQSQQAVSVKEDKQETAKPRRTNPGNKVRPGQFFSDVVKQLQGNGKRGGSQSPDKPDSAIPGNPSDASPSVGDNAHDSSSSAGDSQGSSSQAAA